MTIKAAETELPVGLRGGSDTWDAPQASVVLDADFFSEPASGGGQSLSPTRFDNANAFYSPTVGRGAVTLAPARLDNAQTFYAPTVGRGAVSLEPGLLANENQFFGGNVDVAGADVQLGGHYGAWWADKYSKMFERKPEPPTIEDVLEYVEDEPEEAAAVVREVAPNVLAPSITAAEIESNIALQQLIAEQIIIAAQLRQIQIERDAEEDDIETILLLT